MFIRILASLIMLLVLGLEGYAQNEFASLQLPSRSTENYWVVPDDVGNICVQYYKKPNLYFVVIDNKGDKIREIRHPFRYQPTLFAGNYSNGTFQFYYEPRSKKKEGDAGAFIVDVKEEKLKELVRYDLRASKSENFIGHFSDNKAVYLMISVRGSNVIRVAHLDGEQQPQINTYTAPSLLEKAFRNQEPFLFVNPLALKSVYNYQASKKVYFKEGRLYFTFDHREQFKTHLWKIDLMDKTSELISIPQNNPVFGRSSNSFLYGDQLYRFTADQVKIDLSVYDIHGQDSVVSFTHSGEGKIPFKTGPVRFIDEYGTQRAINEMKNDKLFKTFSNGNSSLFVERINKNNVKVTFGAFNEMASGLSIGGGFGSFGGSGGIAIGGSKQLTGTKRGSTFIHSYLSLPDLVISNDDDLMTSNERIFRYLDKNRRNIYSSKVYSFNEETIHLAYVDHNEAKLRIVEFSK